MHGETHTSLRTLPVGIYVIGGPKRTLDGSITPPKNLENSSGLLSILPVSCKYDAHVSCKYDAQRYSCRAM